MKALHTAALALAAGWLLLNPPLGGGKAPLDQWTVYHPVSSKSTTFPSKAACLAGMDALRHPTLPSEPYARPTRGSSRGPVSITLFAFRPTTRASKNKAIWSHVT
jgi:hypothetical protein